MPRVENYDPRVSVVLATYEGDRFLIDQVLSIINQTRLPDELVVIDDCSTDDPLPILSSTLELIDIELKYHRNLKNCGSNYSFRKGINLSTGDLIFFSDQDDIWYSDKIEAHLNVHRLRSDAMVVINDCEYLIGQKTVGSPTKAEVIQSYHGGLDYFVAGCCTSFKRPVADAVSLNLFSFLNYDDQVHAIGRISKTRVYLNQTLQRYRRHENNQSQLPQNLAELNKSKLIKYKSLSFKLLVEKLFINFFILDNTNLKQTKDLLDHFAFYFGNEMRVLSDVLAHIYCLKNSNTIREKLMIFVSLLGNRNFINILGGFLFWQVRLKTK